MREKLEMFTTDDIVKEVSRRQKEEEQRLKALRIDRALQIEQWLMAHPDAVDILVRDHGRTSCKDDDLANGWGSRSDGGYRCLRCALLQVARGYYDMPCEWELSFELVRT